MQFVSLTSQQSVSKSRFDQAGVGGILRLESAYKIKNWERRLELTNARGVVCNENERFMSRCQASSPNFPIA